MSTHVTAQGFWQDGKLVLADATLFVNQLKRAKFGSGEALIVRVEREEDARTYGQLKYFHGYVLEPLVNWTGDHDWRLYLKVMFLPDGKQSLTELNYEEMRAFIEQAEAFARGACPEAYEQCGREYVA